MSEKYLDDFAPGQTYGSGRIRVESDRIKAFASEFDPQPFHLEEAAAQRSLFGGLAASGWHICAVMMRLLVDGLISRNASLGSPGMEQIRWVKPVRPGDALRCRLKITSARRSRSRPDQGIISMDISVLNQNAEVVMTCSGVGMYRTRPVQLENKACGCS